MKIYFDKLLEPCQPYGLAITRCVATLFGIIFINNLAFSYFASGSRGCSMPVGWFSMIKSYAALGIMGSPLGLSQLTQSAASTMELHFWSWAILLITLLGLSAFCTKQPLRLAASLGFVISVLVGLLGIHHLLNKYD